MVHLGDALSLCHVVDQLNNGREVCWPIKLGVLQRAFVGVDDSIQAVNFGVEDVSVEGEAVGRDIVSGGDGATKSESWNLFVTIIILQDVSD